ncbi:MAG TPA: RecQ family ATP-dependent DNA helicase, partial [Deinococcales bacterium]|nr:RecQ family ATP-dependent DNA helicase [Deinococcales bacterium]
LTDFLYTRRRLDDENFVHVTRFQPERGWEHIAQPIDVSGYLEVIWRQAASITLTSATLTVAGSFDYLRRTLGLPAAQDLQLPGTLPYDQAHVIVPSHLPEARSDSLDEFQRLYARELASLLPAAGRSLSLYTSRERLIGARDALTEVEPLYAPLTRREREEVAAEMRNPGPKAALGTRAFMEGIDFPNLKVVNLERLPFPVPDPLLRARMDRAKQLGLDPWHDLYLPKALLTFTQAFGRLIRDDRRHAGPGAFILWDKRLLRASYQALVFQSLPEGARGLRNLHRPATRAELYDRLANILDVNRSELPTEELVDEPVARLREIRAEYQDRLRSRADAVQAVAETYWKLPRLRDQQLQAVDAALDGRDTIVLLPTGFGKSLTFQLPALLQGGVTLVISPLIALMEDQAEGLRRRGIPAVAINSSRSGAEQRGMIDDLLQGRANLGYVSPERINRSLDFQRALTRLQAEGRLKRLVFDEAHCLSEWGHDFRPDYVRVKKKLDDLGVRVPISCLTATATSKVRQELESVLALHDPVTVRASSDRENLEYYSYRFGGANTETEKLKRLLQILTHLEHQEPDGSVIVYVSTRAMAKRLANALTKFQFSAEEYHAGLSAVVRSDVQERFMGGEIKVIVATNAFGMGVDKANVRAVIHFNPPMSVPAYVQEAGRAGRDGRKAHAVLLHSSQDWKLGEYILRKGQPEERHAQALLDLLHDEPGSCITYAQPLVEAINARLPAEVPDLEPEGLIWLLDTLREARCLDYEHRAGRVQVLCNLSETELQATLGPDAKPLADLGLRRDVKPQFLDFSALPREAAERLSDALYTFGQAHPERRFELLCNALEPALELNLSDGRLATFAAVLERRAAERRRNLELMRAYAGTGGCQRRHLLREFDEEHPAACGRCQNCNGDDAPWMEEREIPDEDLQAVYKPGMTLLEFLETHRERHLARVKDKPYNGLGRLKISMILRGDTTHFVGQDRPPLLLNGFERADPFFGRLEFVREKELERALEEAERQGFLSAHAYERGKTYQITAGGLEHLTDRRRRKAGQVPK